MVCTPWIVGLDDDNVGVLTLILLGLGGGRTNNDDDDIPPSTGGRG